MEPGVLQSDPMEMGESKEDALNVLFLFYYEGLQEEEEYGG
jgi:hypothetical protein